MSNLIAVDRKVLRSKWFAVAFGVFINIIFLVSIEIFCGIYLHTPLNEKFLEKISSFRRDNIQINPGPRRFAIPTGFSERPMLRPGNLSDERAKPDLRDISKKFPPNILNNYRLTPLLTARSIVVNREDGRDIYNVTITTNEYGRRHHARTKKRFPVKHFILFGDSYVFGEGVSNHETLPAQIEKHSLSFRAYNYGLPGGSAATVLADLQYPHAWSGILEPKGIAIYSFIDDHFNRVFGTLDMLGKWGSNYPDMRENANGIFELKGRFQETCPYRIAFFKILSGLNFISFFNINIPLYFRESHFSQFARLVRQLKNEYQANFPNQTFYVLFYPNHSYFARYLIPELEKLEIAYIDYSNFRLNNYSTESVYIDIDGHPNAHAHRILAEQLVKDLSL